MDMLVIELGHLRAMVGYAASLKPLEACGLLGGIVQGDERVVKTVCFLTNVDHSREHFSMDPQEQFWALRGMRRNNWRLIGNFHSHPASEAWPSSEDVHLAFDDQLSYVILSLMRDMPVLRSFRITGEGVQEEPVCMLGEF